MFVKNTAKLQSLAPKREGFNLLIHLFYFFETRVSLSYSFGFPTIHYVDQAGLQITEIHRLCLQVLGGTQTGFTS